MFIATAMLLCQLDRPLTADEPTTQSAVKMALYTGEGASDGIDHVLRTLQREPAIEVSKVSAEQIRQGCLDEFDVVLHPGGSGGGQGRALEEAGRGQVRRFVAEGGGYVGICAGAYLATCDYPWSLHILDARVLDREHWARGFGSVEIGLTQEGQRQLGESATRLPIYYHQGPLLAPAGDPTVEDYRALAWFEGEIAQNGAPTGVMRGTTAIALGTHGRGAVICFSPHPEKWEERRNLLVQGVRLVAKRREARVAKGRAAHEPVEASKP